MNKQRIHYMDVEAPAFYDFVKTCIDNENEKVGNNCRLIPENGKGIPFDYFSMNGIVGITKKPTHIVIKYSNDLAFIDRTIEIYKNLKSNDQLIIIGLWKKQIDLKDNVIIKGKEYVKSLAEKYPELYWCFASANDRNAMIELSEDGKTVFLKTRVLGLEDYPVALSVKHIDKISDANAHEFKRRFECMPPAVIVGNGISIPFGSDPWDCLTNNIFDYLKPFYISDSKAVKKAIGDSNYAMNSLSMHLLKQEIFKRALKECIYRKYEKDKMHSEYSLLHMIAEAKVKYPTMPVLTYNYDCFIENDIEKYHPGFKITNVHNPRGEKKNKEPMIKHIHGIVENSKSPRCPNIVLSVDQYYEAYQTKKTWTYRTQHDVLLHNICLYVGSSMSDLYQMSVIHDVQKKEESGKEDNPHRLWKCFALLCLKDMEDKDKISVINYYISKGVYLIFADDYSKLPHILKRLFDV